MLSEIDFWKTKSICLDLSTPTTVNPKTLLAKGDLFAVSLNDSGKQKLVMQVDRVDEERQIQSQQPGRINWQKKNEYFIYSISILEILMDESIKKTFSISSLVPTYYMVEKIANREVRFDRSFERFLIYWILNFIEICSLFGWSSSERTVSQSRWYVAFCT